MKLSVPVTYVAHDNSQKGLIMKHEIVIAHGAVIPSHDRPDRSSLRLPLRKPVDFEGDSEAEDMWVGYNRDRGKFMAYPMLSSAGRVMALSLIAAILFAIGWIGVMTGRNEQEGYDKYVERRLALGCSRWHSLQDPCPQAPFLENGPCDVQTEVLGWRICFYQHKPQPPPGLRDPP